MGLFNGFEEMRKRKAEAEKKAFEEMAQKRAEEIIKQRQLEDLQLTYNPLVETRGPRLGQSVLGLRPELMLEGPEKYLESERARLSQEQAGAADTLQQQIAQQQAQQQAQMMARGGLRGTNPALLSRFSMKEALMGQQKLGQQAATQRGELESKGYSLEQAIKEKNLETLKDAMKSVEQFNLEKWKKQKEVEAAKLQSQATVAAANRPTKIICTELYKQGRMSEETFKADQAFGKMIYTINPEIMVGYWTFAKPIVKMMKKSSLFTGAVAFIALPWAQHMAYCMGASEKDSLFGKVIMAVGIPMCNMIGKLVMSKELTSEV